MRSSWTRRPRRSGRPRRPNRTPATSTRRRSSRWSRPPPHRRRFAPSVAPAVPRVTGLIIGVDSGVGRSTYLTDTMIVVSLDPVAETVSLVSIPRDMVDVPLSDGRKFRGKINSLVAYARNHPKQFPGSNGKGFDVLMDALGTLLKEPIQYYAKVDLGGFVKVVDTLGGVNVNVARSFCDSHYSEYGYENGFSIQRGRHHLNGLQALAYARVRKPAGESDFTRAARQQEVVTGIRDAVVRGGFLNDPVGLLKAIGSTVETNVPRKKLPDLADAAANINRKGTYRAVITHPLVRGAYDSRGSIQKPDIGDIRALAANDLPADRDAPPAKYLAPASSGSVSGSGVSSSPPARDAQAETEADAQADAEADRQADATPRRRPRTPRRSRPGEHAASALTVRSDRRRGSPGVPLCPGCLPRPANTAAQRPGSPPAPRPRVSWSCCWSRSWPPGSRPRSSLPRPCRPAAWPMSSPPSAATPSGTGRSSTPRSDWRAAMRPGTCARRRLPG